MDIKSPNCIFTAYSIKLQVHSTTKIFVEIAVLCSTLLQQLTENYQLQVMAVMWQQQKYSLPI